MLTPGPRPVIRRAANRASDAGPLARTPSRIPRRIAAWAAAAVAIALPLAASGPALADQARQRQQWVLAALDVSAAWRITQGRGVVVAVIDSGVDPTVSDLTNSVTPGPDYTGVSTPPSNPNWGAHGTWMASLIAGHGHGPGDQNGILGVAPQSRILSIRVITDRSDPGYSAYQAESEWRGQHELARAIRYAVAKHAGVISMSLGYNAPSIAVRAALQYALNHNVVVVASSGNSGTSQTAQGNSAPYSFPADYPGVIGVAAVSESGRPAYFSSENLSVQVAAPGVNVPAQGRGSKYWVVSGTSPACALTAGVAALIRSKYPRLTAAQVRSAITESSSHRPKDRYDDHVGFGTVDAAAALRTAGVLARQVPAGSSRAGQAAAAGQFGNGQAGVAAFPVPPRGRGKLFVLLAIAAACLLLVIASLWLLAAGRRSRKSGMSVPSSSPAGSRQLAGLSGFGGPAADVRYPTQIFPAPPYRQSRPGQGFLGTPGQGYPVPGYPGPAGPGQAGPDPAGPGQGQPGQGYPGQTYPGQGYPGPAYPGQGYPGPAYPGQAYPGPGLPGQGYPGLTHPGAAYPGALYPGQALPDQSYPAAGQPGAEPFGAGQSGTGQSGTGQFSTGPSGTGPSGQVPPALGYPGQTHADGSLPLPGPGGPGYQSPEYQSPGYQPGSAGNGYGFPPQAPAGTVQPDPGYSSPGYSGQPFVPQSPTAWADRDRTQPPAEQPTRQAQSLSGPTPVRPDSLAGGVPAPAHPVPLPENQDRSITGRLRPGLPQPSAQARPSGTEWQAPAPPPPAQEDPDEWWFEQGDQPAAAAGPASLPEPDASRWSADPLFGPLPAEIRRPEFRPGAYRRDALFSREGITRPLASPRAEPAPRSQPGRRVPSFHPAAQPEPARQPSRPGSPSRPNRPNRPSRPSKLSRPSRPRGTSLSSGAGPGSRPIQRMTSGCSERFPPVRRRLRASRGLISPKDLARPRPTGRRHSIRRPASTRPRRRSDSPSSPGDRRRSARQLIGPTRDLRASRPCPRRHRSLRGRTAVRSGRPRCGEQIRPSNRRRPTSRPPR